VKVLRTSSQAVRPEWELILACARTSLDDLHANRVQQLLAGPLDWVDVVATATRHRVEALLERQLSVQDAGRVSAATMASLRETANVTGKLSLWSAGKLVELTDLFERGGVLAVPYKGPTLAAQAYGNFALRPSGDLDFAVRQRDISRACELLTRAGYQPEIDPNLAQDSRFFALGAVGQYCFFSPSRNVLVELHTEKTLRYFPVPLDWEALVRRLEGVAIGGREVRTFSVEDTFLLLCVHGTKHFWKRLSWICDLAELSQNPRGVDWDLAEAIAARMGCRRMWLLGLRLANELLDAPLPEPILRSVRADSRAAALGRKVQAQLFSRHPTLPGVSQRLLFRLQSHERFTQGIRQCVRTATQPTEDDWRRIELPEWATPIYALLRPLRLVQKHGIGLRRKPAPDLSPFKRSEPGVAERMLRIAGVRAGDVLYDLGCGDGQIVVTAARQLGIRAVGVDIDPQRISEARANARRSGVEHLVEFRREDARTADLSEASVVALYLEISGTLALIEKLRRELRPGARIVSLDYILPGWEPDYAEQFDIKEPHPRKAELFLWRIPEVANAPVADAVTGQPAETLLR
jgi:SAM-dependent methyltransferase